MKKAIILCTFAFLTLAASAQQQHFDGKTWWHHVTVLADDNMDGRETGSPGLQRAEAYVVDQLKKSGLLELLDDVGFGALEAGAAGLASFHVVVGQDLDVMPPGLAVEVLLGVGTDCDQQECAENDGFFHPTLQSPEV